MWLIVSGIAAVNATVLHILLRQYRQRLRLGILALMLWGMFIMVLVDHSAAFMVGEPFIQVTTGGLIASGAVLGMVMLILVIGIWLTVILLSPQGRSGNVNREKIMQEL